MAGKRILPRLVDPAKRVRSVGSRGALKAVGGHDGMMVGLAQLKNQYLEAAFLRGSSKAVSHWEQKEKWSSTLLNIYLHIIVCIKADVHAAEK